MESLRAVSASDVELVNCRRDKSVDENIEVDNVSLDSEVILLDVIVVGIKI